MITIKEYNRLLSYLLTCRMSLWRDDRVSGSATSHAHIDKMRLYCFWVTKELTLVAKPVSWGTQLYNIKRQTSSTSYLMACNWQPDQVNSLYGPKPVWPSKWTGLVYSIADCCNEQVGTPGQNNVILWFWWSIGMWVGLTHTQQYRPGSLKYALYEYSWQTHGAILCCVYYYNYRVL